MDKGYRLGEIISFMKRDISELINTKLHLLRLELIEKGSRGAAFFIYGFILLAIVSFALLFGFLALGFYLGDLVNSLAGGFAIVVGFYLIILLILLILSKPILSFVTNKFIKEMDPDLFKEEDNTRKEGEYGCK
ncbi:phage holin family protein [Bacteroidales bacterium OttesenSCG-928-M11]|nr:phage holin family protein [Bacteroidales bacterium OttesenSCG-928-M11]